MLIEEYRIHQEEFYNGKTTQKRIWEMIEQNLMKHGYNVTASQCISKFSGLKKTYKAIKDHNGKSGNDKRTWPYLEVYNISE